MPNFDLGTADTHRLVTHAIAPVATRKRNLIGILECGRQLLRGAALEVYASSGLTIRRCRFSHLTRTFTDGPATTSSAVPEALNLQNTSIITIEFVTGFANVFRSHALLQNKNSVLMLAEIARPYESGFVVTNDPAHKASVPLYKKPTELLGDYPADVKKFFDLTTKDVPEMAHSGAFNFTHSGAFKDNSHGQKFEPDEYLAKPKSGTTYRGPTVQQRL